MNANSVSYKIIYNAKDITRDISDHLISLSYTDKVAGEADELEITVSDKDGLWKNGWYPKKGDSIEAEIIQNGLVLSCGKFSIDEINPSGNKSDGDIVRFSAVAAAITKKLRTKKHTAHENKTLKQLADTVAAIHGLTVLGTIPDIRFGRVTQNHESDLAFLNRIANQYGIIFSVRDTKLVFQDRVSLEKKSHVLSVDKTDITSYSFTDKSEKAYKSARVQYHSPAKNETIEYTEAADGDYDGGEDELVIKQKVENRQQAELVAKSQLSKANTRQQTGDFSMPGNVLVLSGSNIEVTGFGLISGIYHITEATHTLSRDGYEVSADGKRVNKIAAAKHVPKRKGSNNRSATSAATTATGQAGAGNWVTKTFLEN